MTQIGDWEILLVDDEPDSLNLIHDILTLSGAKVQRASGGKECLEKLRRMTPTLIVLDLAMPHPDGWDLLAAIRANPATAETPVVAVTAYYSEKVAARAHEAGFDAFFRKPVKTGSFLAKLKDLIP